MTKSAPGLETLAYTEITAHQSTRLADSDGSTLIFTCQWHPEVR